MIEQYAHKAVLASPITKKKDEPKDREQAIRKPVPVNFVPRRGVGGPQVVKMLLAGILACQAVALATPAGAQKDSQGSGESLTPQVIRAGGAAQPPAPTVSSSSETSGTGVTPTKLDPRVISALAFLVKWGHGGSTMPSAPPVDPAIPVQLRGSATTLASLHPILPVRGAQVLADGSVRIASMSVQVAGTPPLIITGPIVLRLGPATTSGLSPVVGLVIPAP